MQYPHRFDLVQERMTYTVGREQYRFNIPIDIGVTYACTFSFIVTNMVFQILKEK
jgi:hypothetical protein